MSRTKKDYSSTQRNDSKTRSCKNRAKAKVSDRSRQIEENYGSKSEPTNDVSWYYTDTNLADQVGQFSFNQYMGTQIWLADETQFPLLIPTIMSIKLNPCPGVTSTFVPLRDGVNMQGLKTFTALSANNAKTTNYAPQDVTTLLLALGEVCSMVSWFQRALGLAYLYNTRNRVIPSVLIDASGIQSKALFAELAQLRIRFNTILNMANQIPFPSNIAYLDKCAHLYDNIYVDDQSSMAQLFTFNPCSTWKFNEAYNEKGTGLDTIDLLSGTNSMLPGDVLDKLESMIEALLTSSTLNYIYSDVLRYSEKNPNVKLLHFTTVPEDYSVTPIYDPVILSQIHNLRVVGFPSTGPATDDHTKNNDVEPDVENNAIKYRPTFTYKTAMIGLNQILDFPTDSVTIADRIEASRLGATAIGYWANDTDYAISEITMADHYVTNVQVFRTDAVTPSASIGQSGAWSAQMIGGLLTDLTKFSCAPIVGIFSAAGKSGTLSGVTSDLTYFTTVNYDYLKAVNDMA